MSPSDNPLNSERVRDARAPFANTFSVKDPLVLRKPRVGNPGLQFANAFGVKAPRLDQR